MSDAADTARIIGRLLIPDNQRLTPGEAPDVEVIRRRTWRGQAGWAEGPGLCRDCAFWNGAGNWITKPKHARACEKFASLMGFRGPRVPGDARSCRFFKPNKTKLERRAL